MNKGAKRFAIGTVVAAIAGYLAGILTAPKSGKETRKDIKDTAERGITEAEKQLKRLHTELDKVLGQAKQKAETAKGTAKKEIDQAVTAANVVKEKAREVLSAIHEGDADDKDLKKAINDATKAIDHLKTYLKKQP
ncbi:MAG TPA: YtxH domain-containing protein [Nevskiaceae bacterium]|nr:YtxH domain-containing protein [Nevskiaceae bacterium]